MSAEYMLKTAGTADQQFDNTFNDNGSSGGNALVLLNGRSISMKGGKRRKRKFLKRQLISMSRSRARGLGRSRGIRGGFMGSVINQAVVPLALLGLQQTYRRRGTGFKGKSYGRRSRRGRRRR